MLDTIRIANASPPTPVPRVIGPSESCLRGRVRPLRLGGALPSTFGQVLVGGGLAVLLVALPGCGGKSGPKSDRAGGDAAAGADAGGGDARLSDTRPASDAGPPDLAPPPPACIPAASPRHATAAVLTTEEGVGKLVLVDVATRTPYPERPETGSDAVVRSFFGRVLVINRFGADNLQVVDGKTHAVLRQFSTGAGSNPQDVAMSDADHGYLAMAGTGEVLKIDLSQPVGQEIVGRIDVSSLDPDGVPNVVALSLRDRHLLLAADLLDQQFQPRGKAVVAFVDLTTGKLDGAPLELGETNAYSFFVDEPGSKNLLIGTLADFSGQRGGIERIDPVGRKLLGTVVGNRDLGGFVWPFVVTSAGHGFAQVSVGGPGTTDPKGLLVPFTLDGKVGTRLSPESQMLTSVALSDGCELWVTDTTPSKPGVRIYDAVSGKESTSEPISVGLRPGFANSIAFVE